VSGPASRGTVYRCPVCGAELFVVNGGAGDFDPHCCNTDMLPLRRKARFYVCPICKAEVASFQRVNGKFEPFCCGVPMEPAA